MIYTPLFVSLSFLMVQIVVSKKHYVWLSFFVAALYTAVIIVLFSSSTIVVILNMFCIWFWLMFAASWWQK